MGDVELIEVGDDAESVAAALAAEQTDDGRVDGRATEAGTTFEISEGGDETGAGESERKLGDVLPAAEADTAIGERVV